MRFELKEAVGDAELALISRFLSLQELAITGDFSDVGMRHLRTLQQLRRVSIYSPRISDKGICELRGSKLNELFLPYVAITDNSLTHIAAFAELKSLNLTQCRAVTDEGVQQLLKLKNLESLWLTGTSVTDAGVAHIAEMTQFKELGLTGPPVTAEGVKKLTSLKNLETLYVDGVVLPPVVRDLRRALPKTKLLGIPN